MRLLPMQPQVQVNQVSIGKAGYTTYQVAVDFDRAVARDVYGAHLLAFFFLLALLEFTPARAQHSLVSQTVP